MTAGKFSHHRPLMYDMMSGEGTVVGVAGDIPIHHMIRTTEGVVKKFHSDVDKLAEQGGEGIVDETKEFIGNIPGHIRSGVRYVGRKLGQAKDYVVDDVRGGMEQYGEYKAVSNVGAAEEAHILGQIKNLKDRIADKLQYMRANRMQIPSMLGAGPITAVGKYIVKKHDEHVTDRLMMLQAEKGRLSRYDHLLDNLIAAREQMHGAVRGVRYTNPITGSEDIWNADNSDEEPLYRGRVGDALRKGKRKKVPRDPNAAPDINPTADMVRHQFPEMN